MANKLKLDTLKGIDNAIKTVRGQIANVRTAVQSIAVAILEHGAEHGDVTRAIRLVQALPKGDQQRQMVLWFQWYGSIGIDLSRDVCRRLNVENRRSAFVRGFSNGFDMDGARTNNWYEPYVTVDAGTENEREEKAPWFMGPPPAAFVPNTLADFGEQFLRFAQRAEKTLSAKKEVVVDGKKKAVNLYELDEKQRKAANEAISILKLIGVQVGAEGKAALAEAEVERLRQRAKEIEVNVTDHGAKTEEAQKGESSSQTEAPAPAVRDAA